MVLSGIDSNHNHHILRITHIPLSFITGHIYLGGGTLENVMANGNAFTITTVHGKTPESQQFNAFDKTHQAAWVDIFKQGLAAYNNPEDHDSWETGSTISDFQEPIDLQLEERLPPVVETDEPPRSHILELISKQSPDPLF